MSFNLPRGSWDCHFHIYGPFDRFPLPKDAAYHPQPATFQQMLELHKSLGIEHGVFVQAVAYGSDNAIILDAIEQSNFNYRGVALVDHDITDQQIIELKYGGICGIRFNMMGHLPGSRDPQALRSLVERIAKLGLHIQIHGKIEDILPAIEAWQDIDVDIVIDHMARPNLLDSQDAENTFHKLQQVMSNPKHWLKISGIDRAMNGQPANTWEASLNWVQKLIKLAPNRVVWGTDWPHPNIKGEVPNDDELLQFALKALDTPELKQAVFVDNPRNLYFKEN
ncbi:amidohydrolase family protein [Acinetobacter baumannii]|nr:amidohydrolase family protein [Acinetobacter baumannii]